MKHRWWHFPWVREVSPDSQEWANHFAKRGFGYFQGGRLYCCDRCKLYGWKL